MWNRENHCIRFVLSATDVAAVSLDAVWICRAVCSKRSCFRWCCIFDPFRSPYISVLWRHLVGLEAETLWTCSETGWNIVSLSVFSWIFSVGLTHGSEKEHLWCAACELQTSLHQHASLNKYNVNSIRSGRTWTNEKVRIARTIITLRPVNA